MAISWSHNIAVMRLSYLMCEKKTKEIFEKKNDLDR
jgi:hypothetical protein